MKRYPTGGLLENILQIDCYIRMYDCYIRVYRSILCAKGLYQISALGSLAPFKPRASAPLPHGSAAYVCHIANYTCYTLASYTYQSSYLIIV